MHELNIPAKVQTKQGKHWRPSTTALAHRVIGGIRVNIFSNLNFFLFNRDHSCPISMAFKNDFRKRILHKVIYVDVASGKSNLFSYQSTVFFYGMDLKYIVFVTHFSI